MVRAIFDFCPSVSEELPLFVGDVIEVLAVVDEFWLLGKKEDVTGKRFIIPHVQNRPQTLPSFYIKNKGLRGSPINTLQILLCFLCVFTVVSASKERMSVITASLLTGSFKRLTWLGTSCPPRFVGVLNLLNLPSTLDALNSHFPCTWFPFFYS